MALEQAFAEWSAMEPTPEVIAGLRDAWTLHPYTVDGEVRAIAAMSGSEIHFAIAPQWTHRVIARHRTRDFLAPLLAVHGFLTTRTETDIGRHIFLTRIGFERTWFDGRFDHYILLELPFGKRA